MGNWATASSRCPQGQLAAETGRRLLVPLSFASVPPSGALVGAEGYCAHFPLILEFVFQSGVVLTFLLICEVFKECPDLLFRKG